MSTKQGDKDVGITKLPPNGSYKPIIEIPERVPGTTPQNYPATPAVPVLMSALCRLRKIIERDSDGTDEDVQCLLFQTDMSRLAITSLFVVRQVRVNGLL